MSHGRRTPWAAALACVTAAVPAFAQDDWSPRPFEQDGFTVSAPANLTERDGVYTGADGATYPAHIYSLVQGKQIYSVTVADFTMAPVEGDHALDYAVKTLAKQGKIDVDVPARSGGTYGRELNLIRRDRGQSMFSVYYTGKHLYQAEGKSLPPDAEEGSSDAVRFAESLAFMGPAGRGLRAGQVPAAPPPSSEPAAVAVKDAKGVTETWQWSSSGAGKVEYCRQTAGAPAPTCVAADNPRRGDHMPASQTTPMISAVIPGQAWVALGGTIYFCKHTSYAKTAKPEVTCVDAAAKGRLERETPISMQAMSNHAARFMFMDAKGFYCQNVPAPDRSKSQTFLDCVVL